MEEIGERAFAHSNVKRVIYSMNSKLMKIGKWAFDVLKKQLYSVFCRNYCEDCVRKLRSFEIYFPNSNHQEITSCFRGWSNLDIIGWIESTASRESLGNE